MRAQQLSATEMRTIRIERPRTSAAARSVDIGFRIRLEHAARASRIQCRALEQRVDERADVEAGAADDDQRRRRCAAITASSRSPWLPTARAE